MKTIIQEHTAHLILCPACDLELSRPQLNSKQYACCPRCKTKLYKSSNLSPEKQLALSVTGLFLLIVAFSHPLLEMDMYGIYGSATIIEGVIALFNQQFYFVSFLVALCAIVAPTLFLVLVAIISLGIMRRSSGQWLKILLSWLAWSTHWSMLEVYLVAFLVSIFKLNTMADLSYGPGIISLVLLIIINSTIVSCLDQHCYWEAAHGNSSD